MKTIKINWGAGIAGLYLGFVAMIVLLVVMSTRQKIDLVTDQYYSQELKFQSKLDKIKAASALANPVSWEITPNDIAIHYPTDLDESRLSGTIHFYCPSDDTKDRRFDIKPSNHQQTIPIAMVPQGRYKIEIDWKHGKSAYWNEGALVIAKR
ncbi:FixH protein [Dyadobacter jejuensis]|uniref:FixH protein n=1 Tax=Dyadobacter jejuensis TaxID=1082580 RepID=A0A316ANB8_9BACT|nr:FixH family protein [Dyadobacter jejuensis]PWJ59255.1 FixH protein [Dyadobacter jejuensis]